MSPDAIKTVLASLSEREQDEFAWALSTWLDDGALDDAPSDRWLKAVLRAAVARRSITEASHGRA